MMRHFNPWNRKRNLMCTEGYAKRAYYVRRRPGSRFGTAGVVALTMVGLGLMGGVGRSNAAISTVPSGLCPSGSRIEVGPGNATDVVSAWQPGAHLLDNQTAVEGKVRAWEWTVWSPNYPLTASVDIALGGNVALAGVVVASPTFGISGGSLTIEAGGISGGAVIPAVGQDPLFTPLLLTGEVVRVTRSSPEQNVAELIFCSSLVNDSVTTTTTGLDPQIGCDANPPGSPGALVVVCLPFPSGARRYTVRALNVSYGDRIAPQTLKGPGWQPTQVGECSAEEHDRWWVQGPDENVYRTWHPPQGSNGCSFGHEHGDDPRTSVLNTWSGGVPFAYVNEVDGQREEDHVGHKVFVENSWGAVVANSADSRELATSAGFSCHWMSQVHQGTHSTDAFKENAHEYHVNAACDDGASRKAGPSETNSGSLDHTEVSVKMLASFGEPGSVLVCPSRDQLIATGGAGRPNFIPDARRVIACVDGIQGQRPSSLTPVGESRTEGIEELWRPGGIIKNADGTAALKVNPYYQVWDPIRLYNTGSVPKIDHNADGIGDDWLYTIELCYSPEGLNFVRNVKFSKQCDNLPKGLDDTPAADRWKSPLSPFRGMKRTQHVKGITLDNSTGPTFRCTTADGVTQSQAQDRSDGTKGCPPNLILQRIATTNNLWNYPGRATWGPNKLIGNIQGSDVNRRPDGHAAGYGFEWVRFYPEFDNAGIHGPN
jgi:hypothetical protein